MSEGTSTLRWALFGAAGVIAAGTLASFFAGDVCTTKTWLACAFFNGQDLPVLLPLALVLCVLGVLPGQWLRLPGQGGAAGPVLVAVLAGFVFLTGVLGEAHVFQGFSMSRDEVLAIYDSRIFATGHLIAAVAPEFRPFAASLEPLFMLPVFEGAGLVSAYLPVNAGLRALFGFVGAPALLNPLLAAFSVVAVHGVARRLWPERCDAAVVAALLLATSSQLLVTSMTSYAMTAHLALDLAWLWLFLRGGRLGHAAALGVGFLACGLHQLIFHPLFVAPFILRMLLGGRRRLGALYLGAYAAICLFWVSYWPLALHLEGMAAVHGEAADVGLIYLIARVILMLRDFSFAGLWIMLDNALRFLAWQSPLLAPLLALSWRDLREDRGIARELAGGILLILIAMSVLLPYQGHGWGYRYFHGVLGSFALLAAAGWVRAVPEAGLQAGHACGLLLAGVAGAVLVLLPVHGMQVRALLAPYIAANRAIAAADRDFVLVDGASFRFGFDLVRNDPGLQNRPKVLELVALDEAKLASLCGRGSVALFGREEASTFGIPAMESDLPVAAKLPGLRKFLKDHACAPGLTSTRQGG